MEANFTSFLFCIFALPGEEELLVPSRGIEPLNTTCHIMSVTLH
nr:MAG TPA: hypothetical protein [Caudoviricetes sp.]